MESKHARAPRVLVVSHEATRTGAPRVALDLLGAFAGAGWETVCALRWGGPLEGEFRSGADTFLREPWSRLRAAMGRRHRTRRWVPALSRFAARRVIARSRPDLVWCNTVISSVYAVEAAAAGVPSVVFSHEGGEIARRSVLRSGLFDLVRSGGARPLLVGCSEEASQILGDALAVPAEDVVTLRSPVDVKAVRRRAAPPVETTKGRRLVVACGTADHRKGVDVFAAAAAASAARFDDVEWVWVGHNPALPLHPSTGADGRDGDATADDVRFVGEVPDPGRWIAAASVFVLPSRAEGFPLVVMEAMALGRPVVASRLPGPAEQLGDTGVLVDPEDPDALADAVAALLEDPGRAEALGSAAARRCEELWDTPHFAEAVLALSERARREAVPS